MGLDLVASGKLAPEEHASLRWREPGWMIVYLARRLDTRVQNDPMNYDENLPADAMLALDREMPGEIGAFRTYCVEALGEKDAAPALELDENGFKQVREFIAACARAGGMSVLY